MEAILHRALILSLIFLAALHAQSGTEAWLQYRPQSQLASTIATLDDSALITSARDELRIGSRIQPRIVSGIPNENAIVLGTLDKLPSEWLLRANLPPDSYWLKTIAA